MDQQHYRTSAASAAKPRHWNRTPADSSTCCRVLLAEKIALASIWGFSLLFISLIILAQWPQWWEWVIFEMTPMTWLESTLLYTCALLAFGSSLWALVIGSRRQTQLWLLLGCAFFYLAFDERFAIHERVRDNILAPAGIRIPFAPWIAPGDFILLIFLVIGLAVLPRVLSLFKVRRSALILLLAGVGVSAIAVAVDSVEVQHLSIEIQRLQQFIEELIESLGILLMTSAMLLRFTLPFQTHVKMPSDR